MVSPRRGVYQGIQTLVQVGILGDTEKKKASANGFDPRLIDGPCHYSQPTV